MATKQPAWALKSTDVVVRFLVKAGVRVNRHNYVGSNWWGKYDASKPLPPELEFDLPPQLQYRRRGAR